MRRQASRRLAVLVQLAISIGFVYLLLRKANLSQVGENLLAVSLPVLACALVTRFLAFSFMGVRLHYLARSAGGLSLANSCRAEAISVVGNTILPLRLGEVLKMGFMAKRGLSSFAACVGITAVERVVDTAFLVVFIALPVLFFAHVIPTSAALIVISVAACSVLALLVLAAHRPRKVAAVVSVAASPFGQRVSGALGSFTTRFAEGLAALASPRVVLLLAGSTAGVWLFSALSVHIWIAAFGFHLPWYAALVVLVFVALSTAIPSAPGFIGTYHYFAALALSLFGVSASQAASFAIVAQAMATLPLSIALAPFVAKDIAALDFRGIPRAKGSARQGRAPIADGARPLSEKAADELQIS